MGGSKAKPADVELSTLHRPFIYDSKTICISHVCFWRHTYFATNGLAREESDQNVKILVCSGNVIQKAKTPERHCQPPSLPKEKLLQNRKKIWGFLLLFAPQHISRQKRRRIHCSNFCGNFLFANKARRVNFQLLIGAILRGD